jgi:hypothetical protein
MNFVFDDIQRMVNIVYTEIPTPLFASIANKSPGGTNNNLGARLGMPTA